MEFKKLRHKRGLTLRQVEEITGISNAYLSQLENGKIKKPSFDTVSVLCKLYSEPLPVAGVMQGWPDCQTAQRLLLMRDELVKGNIPEAYHQLCLIADPELENLNHWQKLETIAQGQPSVAKAGGLASHVREG